MPHANSGQCCADISCCAYDLSIYAQFETSQILFSCLPRAPVAKSAIFCKASRKILTAAIVALKSCYFMKNMIIV